MENDEPTQVEQPPQQPEPIPFDDAVKTHLQARGVKPRCLACNSIGWANLQVGVVGWLTLQGPAQIALLICKKCAHLEPFDLAALGISLAPPEPSRVITPDQIRKQTQIVMP